jgi:type IV pilus assembly protein PilM
MSHTASYSKFFAPPKFLEMSTVAIQILPSGIYFLTTKITNQGLVPDKHGFVSLAAGDVVQGEIINKEAVIKALIEIRKKTNVKFVRFSIPEEQTYIFKTHLPNLKTEEIRDVLDFKLEENIPLSSKEAVFDYDIITKQKSNGGIELVASVAPLKIIEELQLIFKAAGLMPTFFSPESNNIAKAVVRSENEQILVIVNIKETNIVMSLVVSGVVYQTSSMNFGSSTFTDLLAKYYKTSPFEVAKIIEKKLYLDNPESLEIFSQIINTISAIKDEINKFVSYCNERADITSKVDRIILCGRAAMIIGLTKYLSSNLGMPVEVANIWLNNFALDNYLPELNQRDSLDYAAVNGLNLF